MDLVRPESNAQLENTLSKYGGSDPILLKDFENSLRAAYTIDEVRSQLSDFSQVTFDIKSVSVYREKGRSKREGFKFAFILIHR